MNNVVKYFMRRINKNITSDTIEAYTKRPLKVRIVNGSVKTITNIKITDKTPEIRINLSIS
jgi:hypothetical protein